MLAYYFDLCFSFFLDLKMQFCCLLFICSLGFTTIQERFYLNKRNVKKTSNFYFDSMFFVSIFTIIFDGVTAAAVNRLEIFPTKLNILFHFFFFTGLQIFCFSFCLYILTKTDALPKSPRKRLILYIPQAIATIITAITIKDIEFVVGKFQNYSNGVAAVTTFSMVFIYCISIIILFTVKRNNFERRKKISFLLWFSIYICICIVQSIFRETLLTALGITLILLVAYEWQENPILQQLKFFNTEMVTSFATLIESKDGSTGGHIKRTSLYIKIIANNLRRKKEYSSILTKEYLSNLIKAAPMHDIGKIGIPDYILQKPGSLTSEEYEIMKQHSLRGSKIIKETFGHFGDEEYEKIAFEVATFHHEKWNGKGYPQGLKGIEIPLSARIMAVADVFDAISSKRCYRDAMPLENCFNIIQEGSGTDFDPNIVKAFFESKDEIIQIYENLETNNF